MSYKSKEQNAVKKHKISSITMVRTALVGAMYVALTIVFAPLSYGGIQFRVSEALSILPLFFPESIFGITVGCLIANIFGNGFLDMILGSVATLIAAVIAYIIGKIIKNNVLRFALGVLPSIFINAFVVPFTFLALTELKSLYWLNVLSVGLGQLGVLLVLGLPLYILLVGFREKKRELYR